MKDALSEGAKRFRRQTVSVNIKITFLSWAMECVEGLSVILIWVLGGEKSHSISYIVVPLISFVAIPCTYILNRETTKQIIVLENWFKGLRSTFLTSQEAQVEVDRLQRAFFNQKDQA